MAAEFSSNALGEATANDENFFTPMGSSPGSRPDELVPVRAAETGNFTEDQIIHWHLDPAEFALIQPNVRLGFWYRITSAVGPARAPHPFAGLRAIIKQIILTQSGTSTLIDQSTDFDAMISNITAYTRSPETMRTDGAVPLHDDGTYNLDPTFSIGKTYMSSCFSRETNFDAVNTIASGNRAKTRLVQGWPNPFFPYDDNYRYPEGANDLINAQQDFATCFDGDVYVEFDLDLGLFNQKNPISVAAFGGLDLAITLGKWENAFVVAIPHPFNEVRNNFVGETSEGGPWAGNTVVTKGPVCGIAGDVVPEADWTREKVANCGFNVGDPVHIILRVPLPGYNNADPAAALPPVVPRPQYRPQTYTVVHNARVVSKRFTNFANVPPHVADFTSRTITFDPAVPAGLRIDGLGVEIVPAYRDGNNGNAIVCNPVQQKITGYIRDPVLIVRRILVTPQEIASMITNKLTYKFPTYRTARYQLDPDLGGEFEILANDQELLAVLIIPQLKQPQLSTLRMPLQGVGSTAMKEFLFTIRQKQTIAIPCAGCVTTVANLMVDELEFALEACNKQMLVKDNAPMACIFAHGFAVQGGSTYLLNNLKFHLRKQTKYGLEEVQNNAEFLTLVYFYKTVSTVGRAAFVTS